MHLGTQQPAPTREATAYNHRCSANFSKAAKGVKGQFVQRSASSLSVRSASTSSDTVISSLEVPESSVFTNSPSPAPAIAPAGVEATVIQAKEQLRGWGASAGTFFFVARSNVFSAENAVVERESTIRHRWVASAFSRRSVDANLKGIYIFVDGEHQAPSEGGANPTSGEWCGRRARWENIEVEYLFPQRRCGGSTPYTQTRG